MSFFAPTDLSSFYRASNSILHSLPRDHKHTLITLLYCNCVPILTYACSVKEFNAAEMSRWNTAVNNALRKVFGFHRWMSIRALRESFGMKSLTEILKTFRDRFLRTCTCRSHQNSIVSLFTSHSHSHFSLCLCEYLIVSFKIFFVLYRSEKLFKNLIK